MRACLPDAPLEHRRGGAVPAWRVGRERDRAGADPPGRNTGDRGDPGDDGRRGRRRRCLGVHPGCPEGPARRQRDHHVADAQLRRPVLDPVLGVRPVVRGRLPADRAVPARSLVAAPDRRRERGPGVQRPDRPPRVPVRAPRGDAHLVPAEPDARRLRDPPDRRQPACRALRGHRHQAGDHRRIRHLRRPGRAGRDERGRRRCPPPPGPHLAGLRLHGDHHRLPRPLRTVPGRHRLRAVRGAHPGGARDPAVGRAGDDPGRHPVLAHRRRHAGPLPDPHRTPPAVDARRRRTSRA